MPDANAHAPDMRPSIRKAHRDDPVRNALANFCENLDGAQYLLAGGSKGSAKECVNRSFEGGLSDGLMYERRVFHSLFATADQKEGMDAFLSKRKPDFRNA